eukprot:Hpha_TRINITY_DN15571_c0_g1::TRINITY_DN15571_c0_g1_i3::g.106218::m.106218
MSAASLVLAVLLGGARGSPAPECNLGGELRGGECECYPTYTGSNCAQLALLPSKTSLALYRDDGSSWGGSVLHDASDGRYHMFFANMLGGCGLNSWECNSAVGHAAASTPEGPYSIVNDSLVPPFAHNPTVKAHNGSWYIYHIGTGESYKPFMGNCSDGVTPKGQVCGKNTLDGPAPLGGEGPGVPNVLYSSQDVRPWCSGNGSA